MPVFAVESAWKNAEKTKQLHL